MRFDELGLPEEFINFLHSKGYKELYPPQEEAVKAGLLKGEHLVISSPTACYDGKTEVLTRSGWKLFKDTSTNEEVLSMNPDTFEMEYIRAVNKVEYLYRGWMVHVDGKEIDFRVTENHNMFIHHKHKLPLKDPKIARFVGDSGLRYDFHPAREISRNWKFKTDGIWKGQAKEYLELPPMKVRGRYPSSKGPLRSIRIPMRDFLNFFGWYIAEGSTRFGNGDHEVTLCQKKDPHGAKDALVRLSLGKVSITGSKLHQHFSISSPQLARYLSQFGTASEKFIPNFLKELTSEEIKIFLESYFRGDGHRGRDRISPVFDTTSKRLADDLQELLLKVGISSSVRFDGLSPPHSMPDGHTIIARHPGYEIAGRRYSEHGIDLRRRSKPSFESTDGELVYCLTLPKYHLLYVRRNGKAFWCGNSGKTLIAMLAAYLCVKERGRKMVYLSPLRALASEKYSEFKELEPLGIKSVISTGDFDGSGETLGRYDIILLTNEKFDSILRHGVTWLGRVGLFVSDEVHLAGSGDRGPTLEMILTKIMHMGLDAQLLSLSATISNADEISGWLGSKLVRTNWRPVPLREGVYDYGRIVFADGEERPIDQSSYGAPIDVALDSVKAGGQALIFAGTRRRAVSLATKASQVSKRFLSAEERQLCIEAAGKIRSTGEETGLSRLLAEIVETGAAFHHAGLNYEHRRVVEDYFRARAIKLLAATPTLCLPAGEEIFGNPGPVPIQRLSSNDRVLTHRRSFKSVIAPVRRPYSGPLVKVTPWGQLPMKMTPEHRVLRVTRRRHSIHTRASNRHWWAYSIPEWTESKNLRVGDLVLFPVMKETRDVACLDLPRIGRPANQTGTVGHHWTRLKVDCLELTEDALELFGLYIAEGYAQANGQVMFAFSTDQAELTARTSEWMEGLGLRVVVRDSERHRRLVRCCSKQLASLFRETFGRSAGTKRIPHSFMLLPKKKAINLVRGMWLGDGDISDGPSASARYSTVSSTLAKQLFALLVKIGYMPSIRKTARAGVAARGALGIVHRQHLYTVAVSGKQLRSFVEDVLRRRCADDEGDREFNRGHLDSDYYHMPIRLIEREHYAGIVYNLEVEEDSSYVGSFVVHNSAGVNLPARRVVVADLSRYDGAIGMNSAISVLDYRQMAGRAGRPQYDDYGETVMVPSSSLNPTDVLEHYALGEVEPIESKLGEERGMRVHLLASIASSLGVSRLDIDLLFSKTLLASQVGKERVQRAIDLALGYLISERLVAEKGNLLYATDFGKRVSTLYIDPVTGVLFRDSLRHTESVELRTVGLLHLIAKSPDFEPKFPLREKNYETAYHFLEEHFNELIHAPNRRSFLEYDEILQDMRTVLAIHYWIEEWKEDELLEKLGIEPGDLHRAVDSADWLLYSLGEIAKLDNKQLTREIEFLRKRVNNGVKAELVELTTLPGIGRARARSLFGSGFRSIKALREATVEKLAQVERIGPTLAKRIKEETAG